MMTKERKKDAHEKIQLGGLVVKAGLRNVNKAIILGALLEVADELKRNPDSEKLKRWSKIGKEGF